LRHVEGNKYSLTYYYKNERTIKSGIVDHIEKELPHQDVSKIDIEVFGILKFEDTDPITHMTGEWFDLNGSLKSLGVLMKEKTEEELKGNTSYKKTLSSLMIERSVTANMGMIEFRRQAT